MSQALDKILRERAVLQARSGMLRHEISRQAEEAVARPLGLVGRWHAAASGLLARPAWLAALTTLGLLLRPQRAVKWSAQAWAAWRLWRGIRKLFADAGATR